MAALNFEWDARKAASNLTKHGVSFEEATAVFADPLGRILQDPRHSADEERYVLLGVSLGRTLLAVMYVERGETIRLISVARQRGGNGNIMKNEPTKPLK